MSRSAIWVAVAAAPVLAGCSGEDDAAATSQVASAQRDPIFGFYDVAPGTKRAGSATFDVPRVAVRGAKLEVRAFAGDATSFAVGA